MRTKRPALAARPLLAAALIVLTATPAAAQTSAAPAVAAQNGVGSAFELTFWQSVTGSEDVASYEAYLARYPDGTFSGLARARIAAIQRALAVQPATAPALGPTPAPAAAPAPAPAAPTAAMIPAAASAALAEAAPSPMARLLAQLRATNSEPAQPPAVAAATVQPVPATNPGLAPPATPAAPPAAALTPAAIPAVSYASARPFLMPVPEVVLPAYFCSNDARNQFHNNAYRPAVEVATRNNEAAVGYLRQLQQTYDRGQLGRDTAVLNAIAAEARAYQSEAARAYSAQAALVRQFDAMMAVPLHTCVATAQ